jgi:hypothetical protein
LRRDTSKVLEQAIAKIAPLGSGTSRTLSPSTLNPRYGLLVLLPVQLTKLALDAPTWMPPSTFDGGNIPAVALTAFVRTEDRRRALLSGYQSHLAKHVDPGELIAVVAMLTGRTTSSSTDGHA